MYIDMWSALFGTLVTFALVIVTNHFYGKFFGSKEMRKLKKENRELRNALNEKDKYIRKSLEELEKDVRERQMREEQQ